jgi:drug/metabolite transporter (DMT)-like permease
LGSACLWAVTNLLVKMATPGLNVLAINAYRSAIGSLVLVAILLLTRDPSSLLTIPLPAILALVASVLCGLVIGDTLNFRAMMLIGLARAFPISGAFPLFTLGLAALFLQEVIGWQEVLGCVITLSGVMLVALPTRGDTGPTIGRRANLLGVGLAFCAAMLWAVSGTIVKVGLVAMDALTASAIRLPIATLALGVMLRSVAPQPPLWKLRGRILAAVVLAGLVGSSLSGWLWLVGVQEIGAARAAILSATSPIFAVPLSVLILRERLVPRVLVGTLLSVAGIALVV